MRFSEWSRMCLSHFPAVLSTWILPSASGSLLPLQTVRRRLLIPSHRISLTFSGQSCIRPHQFPPHAHALPVWFLLFIHWLLRLPGVNPEGCSFLEPLYALPGEGQLVLEGQTVNIVTLSGYGLCCTVLVWCFCCLNPPQAGPP